MAAKRRTNEKKSKKLKLGMDIKEVAPKGNTIGSQNKDNRK
jgi:hypothetical protein